MNVLQLLGLGMTVLMVSGCQTPPAWNHSTVKDPAAIVSLLSKDDTECTLMSRQYSGQVQIPAPDLPQSFTATGRTYNPQTGATTFSTYNGQIGGPSGGFAGGFASGMANGAALGEAIEAMRVRDLAYRHCMTTRGWFDANATSKGEAASGQQSQNQSISPNDAPFIYANAEAEWKADTEEFVRFFPSYNVGERREVFNQRVKAIAKAKTLASGPQYLVEALKSFDADEIKKIAPESEDAVALYIRAAEGNARAQAGLSLSYIQKKDPLTPYDPKRAAYWSRKSAITGNAVGQLGFGILLFGGGATGQPERVLGYRWVRKAGTAGVNVESTLQGFRESMSGAELQQVR
jgi:hypothetical protein